MYDMWVFMSFWDFSPKNTPEKIAKKGEKLGVSNILEIKIHKSELSDFW